MPIRLAFGALQGEKAFENALGRIYPAIAQAATLATRDVATYMRTEGKVSIAASGMRAKAFQAGWFVAAKPKTGYSINASAHAFHKLNFAGLFNTGGTTHPRHRSLIWIPLPTTPTAPGNNLMTPSYYAKTIGALVSMERPGRPPMLGGYVVGNARTRRGRTATGSRAVLGVGKITVGKLRAANSRARRRPPHQRTILANQLALVPLFVGVRAAHIPKLWNLNTIIANAAGTVLPNAYARYLAQLA